LAQALEHLLAAVHRALVAMGAQAGDNRLLAGDLLARAPVALRFLLALDGALPDEGRVVSRIGARRSLLQGDDFADDVVEEVAVVGNDQRRAGGASHVLLEPLAGFP